MKVKTSVRTFAYVVLLALGAMTLHGYHYGVDDQFVYLTAIKYDLDPTLYPRDGGFVLSQLKYTLFDEIVSASIRWSHIPVPWGVLVWHACSLVFFFLGAWQVSRSVFTGPAARWAAMAVLAVLLGAPLAGTKVILVEQYLHPRTLALASLLFAQAAWINRKPTALVWLAITGVFHPTILVYGVFHLSIQAMPRWITWPPAPQAAGFALGAPSAWLNALDARPFLFPLRWRWYEWMGVFAPLAILAGLPYAARRLNNRILGDLGYRLALSGALGATAGVIASVVPRLEWLLPFEPMRSLHFPMLMCFLLGGGVLGHFVLQKRPLRWLLVFAPACAATLFFYHTYYYESQSHFEWPGNNGNNAWKNAFDQVRQNTPRDALFALNPNYTWLPGEGRYSFRALAERDMLPDAHKDLGVVSFSPELADGVRKQLSALSGWENFTTRDFDRLGRELGVTWVVLEPGHPARLNCPLSYEELRVCRIESVAHDKVPAILSH